MKPILISFDQAEPLLSWQGLCLAFEEGHKMARAEIGDTFLYRGKDTLLNRSAWIDGLGLLTKTATVFPGNTAVRKPVVNGAVSLFSDSDGILEAMVDFHLVTKWKTAGDSLYAASRLARSDSKDILIIGAGTVGRALWEAYRSLFPKARFKLWNRTRERAEEMAVTCPGMAVADDLETAVRAADIVTAATMTTEPLIRGAWLRPGQHIDLIGAYRPDMREADDAVLRRGRVFVDSLDTTVGHIGEIEIPLQSGAINQADILADFYSIDDMRRRDPDEITVFKNGGGAHLDLMTSRYILTQWTKAA